MTVILNSGSCSCVTQSLSLTVNWCDDWLQRLMWLTDVTFSCGGWSGEIDDVISQCSTVRVMMRWWWDDDDDVAVSAHGSSLSLVSTSSSVYSTVSFLLITRSLCLFYSFYVFCINTNFLQLCRFRIITVIVLVIVARRYTRRSRVKVVIFRK